jgi:hypothetical protein
VAEEGFLADPSVVGVLVDEALTRGRDQNTADQTARRRDRDGDLAGVHAGHVGARAHRHADRAAVVAVDPEAPAAPCQERTVVAEHGVVLDEAAGSEHDAAACPHDELAAVVPHDHAGDAAVALDDERVGARVAVDRRAGALGRRDRR